MAVLTAYQMQAKRRIKRGVEIAATAPILRRGRWRCGWRPRWAMPRWRQLRGTINALYGTTYAGSTSFIQALARLGSARPLRPLLQRAWPVRRPNCTRRCPMPTAGPSWRPMRPWTNFSFTFNALRAPYTWLSSPFSLLSKGKSSAYQLQATGRAKRAVKQVSVADSRVRAAARVLTDALALAGKATAAVETVNKMLWHQLPYHVEIRGGDGR